MKMDWSGLNLHGQTVFAPSQVVALADIRDIHQQVWDVDQVHIPFIGEFRYVNHLQQGVVLPVALCG